MKRRLMGAALSAVAAAVMGLAGGAVQAQANYKAEYKLSTVVGTAFPWGKGGEIWAELVKQRTNGRINIKLYPGTSLVQLRLPKTIRRPGTYRVVWKLSADTRRAQKTTRVTVRR